MTRAFLSVCAFGVNVLLPFATAQAPKDGKADAKEMWVILKAELLEVDDASYQEVVKARWPSLREIEREVFEPAKDKKPKGPSLLGALEKDKPFVEGKEVAIDPGQEGKLLAHEKTIFLPMSPESLRGEFIGGGPPPMVEETLSLVAQVVISNDRRSVRVRFTEKSVALESVTNETVRVGDKDKPAQTPYVQQASITRTRDIPDGSALYLALAHRPYEMRRKGHWLVARVRLRIWIEAEERALKEAGGK